MTGPLLAGIAADLASTGLYGLAWAPGGEPYPEGACGIYLDTAPDRVASVTLNDYGVEDDPVSTTSVVGVQMRFRAPPQTRLVRSLRDLAFDLFHGMSAVTLGGVRVISVARNSSTKLGQTASGLMDWSDNYYFTVHRPGTNRY